MLKSEKTSNNEDSDSFLLKMSGENRLMFEEEDLEAGFILSKEEAAEALSTDFTVLEQQALQFFSGYLIKKALDSHDVKCNQCQSFTGTLCVDTEQVQEEEIFSILRLYDDEKSKLFSPREPFVAFVKSACLILHYCFENYLMSSQIMQSMEEAVASHASIPDLCSQKVKHKTVKLIVRALFFHKLKRVNDALQEKGNSSKSSQRKLKILTHC